MNPADPGSAATWDAESRRRLTARLDSLTVDAPGRWSFAVAEGGSLVAEVDSDLLQPSASTIKVPLMIALLRAVDRGSCDLDEMLPVPYDRAGGSGVLGQLASVRELRVAEALELMVTISDNTATNMVIDRLGWNAIANSLHEMGLARTRLRRHMMDAQAIASGVDNLTTARELALLFDRLGTTELLPPPLHSAALDILGRQQFNDRMPAYLDDDVQCLHKPGELAGRRHDAGVLRISGRWVAFAALSHDLPRTDRLSNGSGPAAEVIAMATRSVVDMARLVPADPAPKNRSEGDQWRTSTS